MQNSTAIKMLADASAYQLQETWLAGFDCVANVARLSRNLALTAW
jgi:hypothetical protein